MKTDSVVCLVFLVTLALCFWSRCADILFICFLRCVWTHAVKLIILHSFICFSLPNIRRLVPIKARPLLGFSIPVTFSPPKVKRRVWGEKCRRFRSCVCAEIWSACRFCNANEDFTDLCVKNRLGALSFIHCSSDHGALFCQRIKGPCSQIIIICPQMAGDNVFCSCLCVC